MMDDSEQQLGSAGPAAADGAPVLSKNQQKKLAKLARWAGVGHQSVWHGRPRGGDLQARGQLPS